VVAEFRLRTSDFSRGTPPAQFLLRPPYTTSDDSSVEVYQSQINRKHGTKLAMPVLCYRQLMTVAYGGSLAEAALDGQLIRAPKLEEIAGT
jgi:hypothetical protein